MSKKIAMAAALIGLFLASSTGLFAARHSEAILEERENDITINPIGYVFGIPNINYEHALSRKYSWLVGADLANYGSSDNRLNILGANAVWRFWMGNRKALYGWYLGPQISVDTVTWTYHTDKDYSPAATFIGAGPQAGHQWVFNGGFTLNLGASLIYYFTGNFPTVSGAPTVAFNGGALPSFNLGLGYAF